MAGRVRHEGTEVAVPRRTTKATEVMVAFEITPELAKRLKVECVTKGVLIKDALAVAVADLLDRGIAAA